MAKIGFIKKSKIKEGLVIGLLLILPVIFNIFTGEIEKTKLITLSVFTIILGLFSFGQTRLKQNVMGKALLVLVAACIAGTAFSYDLNLSLWGATDRYFGLWTWLIGIYLALNVSNLFKNKKSRMKLLMAFAISGTITALIALLLHTISIENPYFQGRLAGALGNPNILGKFMLTSIIPSLFLASNSKKNTGWIWWGLTALQLGVLWGTGNRASWLALLIIAVIYALKFVKRPTRVLTPTILTSGAVAIFSWNRIAELTSVQSRLEMYWAGLKAFIKNPIYGYGFDQTEFFLDLPNFTLAPDRVHQLFLDTALTTGIFGLIAFTILCVGSLIILLKSKDKTMNVFGLSLLALLIALQASFFTITSFTTFTILLGVALGDKSAKRLKIMSMSQLPFQKRRN